MRSLVMRYSSHVLMLVRGRMLWVHVAAVKILMIGLDYFVADAWSKHPKGSAKHRSPIISNAIYASVYVVSQVVAEDNDSVSAYTN